MRFGSHGDEPISIRFSCSGKSTNAKIRRKGLENAVAVYCVCGVGIEPHTHVGAYRVRRTRIRINATMAQNTGRIATSGTATSIVATVCSRHDETGVPISADAMRLSGDT